MNFVSPIPDFAEDAQALMGLRREVKDVYRENGVFPDGLSEVDKTSRQDACDRIDIQLNTSLLMANLELYEALGCGETVELDGDLVPIVASAMTLERTIPSKARLSTSEARHLGDANFLNRMLDIESHIAQLLEVMLAQGESAQQGNSELARSGEWLLEISGPPTVVATERRPRETAKFNTCYSYRVAPRTRRIHGYCFGYQTPDVDSDRQQPPTLSSEVPMHTILDGDFYSADSDSFLELLATSNETIINDPHARASDIGRAIIHRIMHPEIEFHEFRGKLYGTSHFDQRLIDIGANVGIVISEH